ncbi:MAG: phosphate-starvation-inducible PsiE family protein [Candidatus Binatia bacterium]
MNSGVAMATYKSDHTGAKSQLGGVQFGLLSAAYHAPGMNQEPMNAVIKTASRKTTSADISCSMNETSLSICSFALIAAWALRALRAIASPLPVSITAFATLPLANVSCLAMPGSVISVVSCSNLFLEKVRSMQIVFKKFEQVIVLSLIAMMAVVVLFATIELAWIIYTDLSVAPYFMIEIDSLLKIFGFFLLILIGIELIETIKAYLAERVIHVEIVLEVALIAIARKVIILDLKDYSGLTVLAIAAVIVSLAIACYLEKRSRGDKRLDLGGRS